MFQRSGSRIRDTWLLSGWLFADLLLALVMIFLISINGGNPPPRPCATPAAAFHTRNLASLPWEASGAAVPHATPTPCSSPTPTPTPTPAICGLDKNAVTKTFTVADPQGLGATGSAAQQSFDKDVQSQFAPYATRTAGFVEIFGGGSTIDIGQAFARRATGALGALEDQHFIFDKQRTVFRPFGDLSLGANEINMYVLFFLESNTGSCP